MIYRNRPFRWASHNPILESSIKVFSPKKAIELGMGFNSTPLLKKNIPFLVSVDHDRLWFKKVVEEIPRSDSFIPLFFDVGDDITRKNLQDTIPEDTIQKCKKFYKKLIKKYRKIDLLFIDQYAGFRFLALTSMYKNVDIIVFHDTHESQHYGYDGFYSNYDLSDFYSFRYLLKGCGTDILIRRSIVKENLKRWKRSLRYYGQKFCNRFETSFEYKLKGKEK